MKVFVTGATGYVGNAVARAFRNAGHRVHGLARSDDKARRLAAEEILPVVGDLAEPASWRDAAADADALVHCASESSAQAVARDRAVIDAFVDLGRAGGRRRAILYTSGVWVYGSPGGRIVDEETPPEPIPLVAWRVEHERRVLEAASAALRTVVLRPGCVYGRSGSLTGLWFRSAAAGAVEVVGDGSNHWALVHLDDLGDAYVRAAERDFAGLVDVADGRRHRVGDLAAAAARAAGSTAPPRHLTAAEATARYGGLAQGLLTDCHLAVRRVRDQLGWRPRHPGFVEDVEVLWQAWRAAQA